jgi:chemotaxis protein CheC
MKDEMDILREVGSIAVGHGSIALSEMLGRKINVELPSLELITADAMLQRLSSSNELATCVSCNSLGGLKGEILVVL